MPERRFSGQEKYIDLALFDQMVHAFASHEIAGRQQSCQIAVRKRRIYLAAGQLRYSSQIFKYFYAWRQIQDFRSQYDNR